MQATFRHTHVSRQTVISFMVIAVFALIVVMLSQTLGGRSDTQGQTSTHDEPAVVEAIAGSELSRITLTADAARRLDIKTAPAQNETVNGATRPMIPYAAVIYDAEGKTWAYTNPSGLVYVRQAITVESIEGDRAILSAGPPAGTAVVVVGASELLGAEYGVGH
jgi:hypothetical protein